MPLSSAPVDRSRLHVRAVTYEGYRRGDDLFDIEGHLTDVKDHDYTLLTGVRRSGEPVHDMWIRLTIGGDYLIRAIEVRTDEMPYPGACDLITPAYDKLVGASLLHGFRRTLQEAMGGVRGCSHLTELSVARADRGDPDVRRSAPRNRRRRAAVPARSLPCAGNDDRDRTALLPALVSRRGVARRKERI